MSVRVVRAAVAAGLLASGFGPLAAPQAALAPGCLSFTDARGDSAVLNTTQAAGQTNENALDILGAAVDTSGGELTMAIKVADLSATGANRLPGDRFTFRFLTGAKVVQLVATRDVNAGATAVTWTVDGTAKTPKPTVTYATDDDMVVATLPLSDLNEAAAAGAGATLRSFSVDARGVIGAPTAGTVLVPIWDTATSPLWYTHTVGTPCSAASLTVPIGTPDPACNDVTDDGKGDGKMATPSVVTGAPQAETPDNEQDLDIVGVVGETTPTELRFHIRVDRLKTLPDRANGHNFKISFVAPGGKVVSADVSELHSVIVTTGVFSQTPRVIVGGTDRTSSVPSWAYFDRTKNLVTIALDRSSVAFYGGEPIPSGSVLTTVFAESRGVVGAHFLPADEAPNTADAAVVYKVGTNACFTPPPAKLTSLAAVRVQYGDVATVSAKLTDEDGVALAGKPVRFAVAPDAVTATTDAAGLARTTLKSTKVAGLYSMTVSFAGDSMADNVAATTPFTVVVEKSKTALSVVKSGSKRTVTATLKDDDGTALAGQRIIWKVNGTKVATATTNSRGQAVLKTAKPTQTVTAEYAGLSGKYAASKASSRV